MSMRLTLFSYHFCFTKRITSVSPSFSVVFFAFILYNESMRKGGKYLWQQKFFVHGSGHKATSWKKTISYMADNEDIVCPDLSSILEGKEASYENLYSSFVKYCNETDGQIHLCGLSLGGILALNYALDFPQKVKTLVLIGTPCKVPKAAFAFQNIIFRFFTEFCF